MVVWGVIYLCKASFCNKSRFIDRERFGKYSIVENLNRVLWSSLVLLKLLSDHGFESPFPPIIVMGILHLLLSLTILSWRRLGDILFFSYPFVITLIDVVYMTAIIPHTGLLNSHMYLLYVFPITIWGLRCGLKGALVVAPVISLLYLGVSYINLGSIPLSTLVRVGFFVYFSLHMGLLCERTQNKMFTLATRDGLTSLYNQKYFYDNLSYLLGQAHKDSQPVSLALLDLDNFKEHNDQLGHLIGDQLLKRVSTIVKSNIRSTDVAARYGGDEFVIIFPNTDCKSALQVSERIRRSIEEDEVLQDAMPLSVSVGVAVFPEDGATPSDLFDAVDKSLYRAKNQGKNIVVRQTETLNL